MVQRNRSKQARIQPGAAHATPRRQALYLAVVLAVCEFGAMQPALAQSSAGVQTAPATAAAPASTSATAPVSAAPQAATAATTAAPAAAAEPAPQTIQSVNVVGERQNNRIDRQVYDVKSDVNASNGSAADALGNVPSVAVDPDGTVSLRGSSNVQILVDGKPSAMLQGENRGSALQAMPAEDIDSVEVINNPGAEFGNEGGGGPILNLVMKRNRRPGGFGAANANVGTAGRHNASLNGAYNSGLWGFQGGINMRKDGRDSTYESERERIDPVTGASQRNTQESTSNGLNDSVGLRGQVTYNLSQDDTLEAGLGLMKRSNDQHGLDHYSVFDQNGNTTSDYERSTRRSGDSSNNMGSLRWDHKGAKLGELFKMDLRVSTTDNDSETDYANTYTVTPPRAADSRNLQDVDNSTRIIDYTGDYELPLESGAIVKVGYKIADNGSEFDTRYYDFDLGSNVQSINDRRTNAFEIDEMNTALYGSYQWKVNERWGAQLGLRAEHTDMDLKQVTSRIDASNSYLNWMPSAFATYKLGEKTNLRFSYAHRIRRPGAGELNPFVVYRDEFNESSGNPYLKPVQTDSFEVGYETKAGVLDANVRAYYRNERDTIRSRQLAVSDTVILTTLENGGSNRSGGIEFTLSGKLTPKLSVNTSGNVFLAEQQQIDLLGNESKRSATSVNVRGRLNYQLTPLDQLQLMFNAQGKTLTGYGYREPSATANLSYRRNLNQSLTLVVNANDIFSSQKQETVTDSATLKEYSVRRFDGPVVFVGLSYRFGGVQANRRQDGPPGEGWRPPPGGMPPGGFGGGPGGGGPGM
ncbi:outer membrane beta-barrel family protein [Massilia brevitalea]|uniref:outer membrane beta-barrel family protein n=1 Tax=Massilia brevitalea TaxID=442526 RepID=UPI002738AE8B|nr:outer membrane beta-barrel family protein [Massilia brevitalea]